MSDGLSLESISADGRQLVIRTTDSPCAMVTLARIAEDSTSVTLHLRVTTPTAAPTTPPSGPVVCLPVAHIEHFHVALQQPLAGRTVISARDTGT
jgi:hypothetical protein